MPDSQDHISANSQRIARNTFFLYLRQFFILLVSLYTGRVVLDVLGDVDYGTYNIVAAVVVLFSFLQSALTTSVQRYMNCSLGKDDSTQSGAFANVFVTSVNAHIILAGVILLLSETLGLWILEHNLVIPEGRMQAARWVYQISVVNCCLGILRTPHNAAIVAHERMDVFAYVGIAEVMLKLALVFVLVKLRGDRLVWYAVLNMLVSILLFLFYVLYCHFKVEGARYRRMWDKGLLVELLTFSGWNLFGSMANVGTTQGINIFLNNFFGVTVNAAMGVMNKVVSAINSFCTNFQTAFVPQLMKSYSSGDRKYFFYLIFRTSKFSFFLLYLISLPFIFYCKEIMDIWLVDVPLYAVQFTQLTLIFYLIDAISGPFWQSVQATGKIRDYQIVMSIIILLNLPISFILLKHGCRPELVLMVRIAINLLAFIVRLCWARGLYDFPVGQYLKEIFSRIALVAVLSLPVPMLLTRLDMGVAGKCLSFLLVVACTASIIFFIGMQRSERDTIIRKIKAYVR